jgi:peptide/nickel transport system substrate-binding protein
LAAAANVTRRPRIPFIGVTVAVAIFVLAWYFGGSSSPAGRPGTVDARRGGQIVASIRSEPRSFNRLLVRDEPSDTLTFLMQGRLVRLNRATFELEPWLAERWDESPDGLSYTMHLRPGVTWSDGTAFSADDVVFTLQAALDPKVESVLADNLKIGGQPLRATAIDAQTVRIDFPALSGPGLRLLDSLPILPRHKLEAAYAAGTFASAWGMETPPADLAGTGPFVLREYVAGQRVVLDRNPRYWRRTPSGDALPYLDRIVLELVPEQNAELLRLQSGALDLTQAELRPEDYVPVRRAEEEGTLTRVELGVSPNPDAFWFCLNPDVKKADPRFAFVQKREFRQAISHAVDREEFAQTVFLGEAVPIWGPITPGNRRWFTPNLPRYPHDDVKARAMLRDLGLEDRDGNGVIEDAAGTEARFTVLVQRGLAYLERGTMMLREELGGVGIALDIAPLETGAVVERLLACNYDAIYFKASATDLDPAGNMDFWLSSGSGHFWNFQQKTPATAWEAEVDALMTKQAATLDLAARREIFNDVQQIFAENLPALYFVAPRMYVAHSRRLAGVVPSVMRPTVLWSADTLNVTD